MARVSKEKAAETRERILDTAARLFRERGFDGTGVDAIMKAAGLTHGGFYGHFKSKEELMAEVTERISALSCRRLAETGSLADWAERYLSAIHRDDPGDGCVLAALGPEIGRQSGTLRRQVTEAINDRADTMAARLGGGGQARAEALRISASLVGAVILARAVDDPALSDEILAATRQTFAED